MTMKEQACQLSHQRRVSISETFARQLRDPAIFQERGKIYLLYTVGGESGIAISELVSSEP